MALTLLLFAAVQLLMPTLIRPHVLPSDRATAPYNPSRGGSMMITNGGRMTVAQDATIPGVWVISNTTITPTGNVFTGPAPAVCMSPSAPISACDHWLAGQHLRQLVTYQPDSRFWPLQWTETAIYLAASAGLGGICVWQVRRKRA
jgi:hypothetical protein